MPSAPTPEPRRKQPGTSKRTRYVIRQHPRPAGFELVVEDEARHVLFTARPRLVESSRFEIAAADAGERRTFTVKLVRVGLVTRYVLLDGESERLSLLTAFPSPEVLVRDGQRRVIARFRLLGPGLVVLRAHSTVHARLRFTQYAAPAGLQVRCETEEGSEWLLAVLLYAIVVTEQMTQKEPISEFIRTLLVQQAPYQP